MVAIVFFLPVTPVRQRVAIVAAAAASAVALALSTVIGIIYYRPRPAIAFPHLIHSIVKVSPDSSFPSDHTAVAFAIAVPLAAAYPKAWPVWIAAVLIGFGRVSLGAHWPSDVIAGGILGAILGLVAMRAATALRAPLTRFLESLPLPRRSIRRSTS